MSIHIYTWPLSSSSPRVLELEYTQKARKHHKTPVFFYLRRREAQRTDPRCMRNRFLLRHANRPVSTMQYQRGRCTGAGRGVGPLTAPSPSTILISESDAYSLLYTSAILDSERCALVYTDCLLYNHGGSHALSWT